MKYLRFIKLKIDKIYNQKTKNNKKTLYIKKKSENKNGIPEKFPTIQK